MSDPASTLSVCIITRNEARNIRDCLESVTWADEILVLDSCSEDDTEAICREYTEHFYINEEWLGFGVQKNRVLDLATSDWVLSLDADERVTPALRAEIETVMTQDSPIGVYQLPRQSYYCGRQMRHSGWWPDYVVRLFKRGHGRFSDDLVHERLLFEGRPGRLSNPLTHFSYHDLSEVLERIERYSTAGAENQRDHKRGSLGKAVTHAAFTFIKTYLLRLGFLDGREGFMVAVSNAETVYYRYLKMYYWQREHKSIPKG